MIRIGARLGTTLSSQVCEIPKTPHPVPQNRGKTSNVQHRTSNAEVSEDSRCHSMFGVRCSVFDVGCSCYYCDGLLFLLHATVPGFGHFFRSWNLQRANNSKAEELRVRVIPDALGQLR